MVTISRTMGILRRVTGSAVSSAAAIAGSAEFLAPLILTVPWSGFPPHILNLSIHPFLFSPRRLLFVQRPPQHSSGLRQLLLCRFHGEPLLQHNQRQPQIVAALTQCVFNRGQVLTARLLQYS